MTTVLVTGPIGGGKSTVCRHLADAGYPVYDCDSGCKALYDSVPGLKLRIEDELGLPFEELGKVFARPRKLAQLEKIVYPYLVEDIENWKASLTSPLAFIESAIALQKPEFSHLWDKVLLVDAPAATRHSRNPQAAVRESLQHYDGSLIDYTIRNDSDLGSLYTKVDNFIASL